jgi:hypothetical protein
MNIYVPYAGEPRELLDRTIASIGNSPLSITVIDNSYKNFLSANDRYSILTPPAPLTLWQTIWMLCRIEEPFIWTQCDAIFQSDAVFRLLNTVEKLESSSITWGVVFTHYDILSAVNAPLLHEKWLLPDLGFVHYHGDIDWYRRIRLAGLQIVEAGGNDVSHSPGGGAHWRSSPERDAARKCIDSERLYVSKWGGGIGSEKYITPWGR